MDISKFLSKVLGIYFVFVSVVMLTNMQQFINSVNTLIHDAAAMIVAGFFTLILGILMVVSHNIWRWHWQVIITLIAWISLLKGASILIYPQFINQTSILFVQHLNVAYVAAGFDFILGITLCYFGFKR